MYAVYKTYIVDLTEHFVLIRGLTVQVLTWLLLYLVHHQLKPGAVEVTTYNCFYVGPIVEYIHPERQILEMQEVKP